MIKWIIEYNLHKEYHNSLSHNTSTCINLDALSLHLSLCLLVFYYCNYINIIYFPSQAGVVLSQLRGRPLSICVLRWRARDGTVYRPLVKLLRALRAENPHLQLGPAPCQQPASISQRPPSSQCLKEGR